MEIGIIGLPLSGKTVLFSALTGLTPQFSHISGKIEVHRGVVEVPDPRLDELTKIFKPKKQVNATIQYLEVGGLEKDSGKGKGFDPQFLTLLKNTDALCVVIRMFEDKIFPHPLGSIDSVRDIQIIETEFILSDLGIVENRIQRLEKQIMKGKTEEDVKALDLMKKCQTLLEEEHPLREIDFSEQEEKEMRGYQFLSAKPVIFTINYGEQDIPQEGKILDKLKDLVSRKGVEITGLSAKVEMEISQLEADDKILFLEELGISEPASHKLIKKSYGLLGLISFFTVGDPECHAWTIKKNTPVQKAAGSVHSDLERGFIRAEVINYSDFTELKSMAKCREKGILRLEGKEYIVQDGDIVTVRFNV
jgi:GTP-binding protein YchF